MAEPGFAGSIIRGDYGGGGGGGIDPEMQRMLIAQAMMQQQQGPPPQQYAAMQGGGGQPMAQGGGGISDADLMAMDWGYGAGRGGGPYNVDQYSQSRFGAGAGGPSASDAVTGGHSSFGSMGSLGSGLGISGLGYDTGGAPSSG